MQFSFQFPIGASLGESRTCQFRVWAPNARNVQVHLASPKDRVFNLHRGERGFHFGEISDTEPGTRYVVPAR